MCEFVPETAISYEAIFERGGANCGDEGFALFKCPNCGHIYLFEYEVDTVYLDANDLKKRIMVLENSFDCLGCGEEVPQDGAWSGSCVDDRFRVTWAELNASDWAWAVRQSDNESKG